MRILHTPSLLATLSACLLAAQPAAAADHKAAHAAPAASASAPVHKSLSDADAIRAAMMHTWDKPEERLNVTPVVHAGNYGLASWTQGPRGGRAVLEKHHGKWSVIVCGGDGILDASALTATGMSAATAQQLVKALKAEEQKLDGKLRAQFASFQGWVKVGPQGHHAPHGKH